VSGISSGGAMAVQYQVAYSRSVAGAAVMAAPPWYCAEGSIPRALGACMQGDPPVDVRALAAIARREAAQDRIDPLDGLAADVVWVFHGSQDAIVAQPVTDALVAFYREFMKEERNRYETGIPAAHGFPTEDAGIACGTASEPWLVDCDYDAAGALLARLYGPLKPKVRAHDGQLRHFDQSRYAVAAARSSLEPTGYLYVPKRCEQGADCRVHVAFHGCRQGSSFVGQAFVRDAGYNAWAESNDIVVLYPQVARTLFNPLNPQGCWDWWGYTGTGYATREGAQLASVRRMLDALGLAE
jgi:poly(3-hydroxybutyrate) depolymerase